jgi:hypothetical protein
LLNKKLILAVLVVVGVLLIMLMISINNKGSERASGISLDSRFQSATLRNDVEPLLARFPGIDIISCQWKAVYMDNGGRSIPGPSDTLVCGYIETPKEYFNVISHDYKWVNYPNLVVYMLPVGLGREQLNFMSSTDYNDEFRTSQNGARAHIHVDFDNELIYFFGTISGDY